MSECRSCGATIRFIETSGGKWHPVDPDLLDATDCETGDLLVSEDGVVHKVTDTDGKTVIGYISHFATCPQADKWRKGK